MSKKPPSNSTLMTRIVRKALKKQFPDYAMKVRQCHGGSSLYIDVIVDDIDVDARKLRKEVEDFVNFLRPGSFNAEIDLYECHRTTVSSRLEGHVMESFIRQQADKLGLDVSLAPFTLIFVNVKFTEKVIGEMSEVIKEGIDKYVTCSSSVPLVVVVNDGRSEVFPMHDIQGAATYALRNGGLQAVLPAEVW